MKGEEKSNSLSEVENIMASIMDRYYYKLESCLKDHLKSLVKIQRGKKLLKINLSQISAN